MIKVRRYDLLDSGPPHPGHLHHLSHHLPNYSLFEESSLWVPSPQPTSHINQKRASKDDRNAKEPPRDSVDRGSIPALSDQSPPVIVRKS